MTFSPRVEPFMGSNGAHNCKIVLGGIKPGLGQANLETFYGLALKYGDHRHCNRI